MDLERFDEVFALALDAGARNAVSELEVAVGARKEALTRFANNAIHQSVAEESRYCSVRVVLSGRTARASTNSFAPEAIGRAVDEAVALARASAPDEAQLPLAEAQPVAPLDRFSAATADASPGHRSERVRDAIRVLEPAGQTAAGIYSTGASFDALLNTRGVRLLHGETMARFSITAMASDSSGWAKASATDVGAISPVALARRAAEKARASASPREMAPGRYKVILEPAAVLDLVGQIFGDFSGTALSDQRSFLTDRLGQTLFGANISINDDVRHPLQAGPPFDAEGVPRTKLNLVQAGAPREVAYSRRAARDSGVAPTGHGFPLPNDVGEAPVNIVIAGGDTSLAKMIEGMQRGLLVTRLWYIREVDPYEKIMTGMTRDGTFLVEDGRIVCGVRNFRFNQSVVEMLRNVESLSAPERASGEEAFDMVVPAMTVNGFHFTEVTRF